MKIGQIPGVGGTYDTKGAGKIKRTEGVQSKKDVASISGQGQIISKAKQVVNGVPDVRQSEVDRLKPEVDSGNYNVSGKEILQKMTSKIDIRT